MNDVEMTLGAEIVEEDMIIVVTVGVTTEDTIEMMIAMFGIGEIMIAVVTKEETMTGDVTILETMIEEETERGGETMKTIDGGEDIRRAVDLQQPRCPARMTCMKRYEDVNVKL